MSTQRARGRPAALGMASRLRGQRALEVELHGDALEAVATGVELEHTPHDGGLGLDDLAGVRAPAGLVEDGHVAVAEQRAAYDVAALGLALECAAGPLRGLRAFDLGRTGEHGREHLVGGQVEAELPATVLRFVDADARLRELL